MHKKVWIDAPAGMRREEGEKRRGDEIYSDYMWMLSIMPCGSVAPVIKHSITQH